MSLKNYLTKNIKFLFFLLLGVLLSFSLTPYNYISFCFIAFPLLLYLLKINQFDSPSFFFIYGVIFSFGYFFSSLYWISYSLNFDPEVEILKPFAIIILPLAISLFYGISFLILRKLFSFNFFYILNFSIILSLTEYFRSYLTGFSWNLFSYALSDELKSIQLLNIFGTFGVNFLAILLFSFPYLFFCKNKKKSLNRIIIFFSIISLNYIYGHERLKTNLETKNQNVVIVQPNKDLIEIVSLPEKYIENLIRISNPKEKNTDTIFLWPEGSYSHLNKKDLKKTIQENFRSNQKVILGGNTRDDIGNIYNTFLVYDSNGNIINQYRKIHLVPFGEFIPFENLIKILNLKKVTFGYQSFSKGTERNILNINNNFILPLICYEIIDSGNLNISKKKFDVIFNISEDAWFSRSIGTHQHYAHSIFRSIEEGKHIYRSTNQGLSASINPLGVVKNKMKPDMESIFVGGYEMLNKKTVFSVMGNLMFFFLILMAFLIQLFQRRYFKIK